MSLRPDTFELTLPDNQKVRCWVKDIARIRLELAGIRAGLQESIILVRSDKDPEVFDHIPWDSAEGRAWRAHPGAQRIG